MAGSTLPLTALGAQFKDPAVATAFDSIGNRPGLCRTQAAGLIALYTAE